MADAAGRAAARRGDSAVRSPHRNATLNTYTAPGIANIDVLVATTSIDPCFVLFNVSVMFLSYVHIQSGGYIHVVSEILFLRAV